MARKVVLLDTASRELTELGLYIASQSSAEVANGYLDPIYAACMALTDFPERGRRRDDILPGLRIIGFERRVTIAFRVLKTRVEIVTIAYGGGISSANFGSASRMPIQGTGPEGLVTVVGSSSDSP